MQRTTGINMGCLILGVTLVTMVGCSNNSTMGPSGAGTPTPVAATAQTLFKNGVNASQWLGQPLTLSQTTATDAVVAVTDGISGDGLTLAVGAPAGSPGYININGSIPTAANASNFSASGHAQFDIMLGSAFNASTTGIYVGLGNSNVGCSTASLSTMYVLTTSAFVHVSIPFSTFTLCGSATNSAAMAAVNSVTIYAIDSSGFAAGTQFYVDNVQWTPN